MRITIVHGFFLPVPPTAGGAMEKAWWSLARQFSAAGHQVVSLSRRWPGLPDYEIREGVICRRFSGCNHTASLPINLLRDAWWGLRLLLRLPPADILITNTVLLPALAPWLRPHAGLLVVNLNRFPKGQLRAYRCVSRLQVPSRAVLESVRTQCPRLLPVTQIVPNPIELDRFRSPNTRTTAASAPVRLGYIGRIHPEKGLELLLAAANLLARENTLPPWILEIRGPTDIPRGGGGDSYLSALHLQAAPLLAANRLTFHPPEFDPDTLAVHYGCLDVFVYPSLAERGETFGVAVAEAMAAGAVPIVSDLLCFADLVTPGKTGLMFPRAAPDAAAQLARAMSELIRNPSMRISLAGAAILRAEQLGVNSIASDMLIDFQRLLSSK